MRHRSRLQTLAQSLVLLASLIGPGTWGVGAFAADRFAVANNAWNTTATWSATPGGASGASIPVAGDVVFIGDTATARAVTIPAGYAAEASSVTLGTTGGVDNAKTLTLSASNASLTVSGNLTVNKPSNNSINNLLNVNAGTVTVNGTVTLGGTAGNATRDARIVITTGTLNIGGDLVFVSGVAGNNIIDMSASSGTINLAGAFTATFGTIQNPGTSVFNYNGTAAAGQTALIGVSSIIYQNLHFNNTGTNGATLSAAISATNVLGNVRLQSGILNNGGFAMVGGAGDTFEVANNARLNLTGASTMATGFATITLGATSIVEYSGTTQNVAFVVGASGYGHLILSGTLTKTALGTFTVRGNLSISGGTFADGGNQITGNATGTMTMAASTALTLGSVGTATTFPTLFTAANTSLNATSTVTYASGAAQTVSVTPTYGNLTFSGAGIKTAAAGVLTIAGNWDIGSAADLASTTNVTLTGASKQISNASATVTIPSVTIPTLTVNGTCTNNATGIATTTSTTIIVSTALSGSGTLTQGATQGVNRDALLTINGTSGITNLDAATNSPNLVTYSGGAAQTVKATTYHDLTINNTSNVSLGGDSTVNGTLTFTAGKITTGATNTLTIGSAGSISGAATSRYVVGDLKKVFSALLTFTYHIGDGTNYTPLAVTFSAAVTGNLTASVTNTDHPNTTGVTSGIDAAKSINRYWTLKNSTISGTYTATLNYIDGTPVDRDSGATFASFIIRRGTSCTGSGGTRTCPSWASLTVSGTSNTQATATGVSIASGAPESDFAVGEAASTRFSREKEFIFTRELY